MPRPPRAVAAPLPQPLVLRAGVMVVTLLTLLAGPLAAQALPPSPADAAPAPRTTWQYGVLVIDRGGGAHRFAGPAGQLVEARRPLDFLRRLAADSTVRLREGSTDAELQAASLSVLGRDGWELVGCQFIRRELTSDDTVCHLKRPAPVEP